ncbi:MAG: hypothetical protein R3C27_03555 [Hyphomonadaceae bacterium]
MVRMSTALSDRVGAFSAFVCAAFCGAIAGLGVNSGTIDSDSVSLAMSWLGWLLAAPIPIAMSLVCVALVRRDGTGFRNTLTLLPLIVALAVSAILGLGLANQVNAMGDQSPPDGALSMGFAFLMMFLWMLLAGTAVAALLATWGIAARLGTGVALSGWLAAIAALASFVFPFLILPALLMLAFWWAAVGRKLLMPQTPPAEA